MTTASYSIVGFDTDTREVLVEVSGIDGVLNIAPVLTDDSAIDDTKTIELIESTIRLSLPSLPPAVTGADGLIGRTGTVSSEPESI